MQTLHFLLLDSLTCSELLICTLRDLGIQTTNWIYPQITKKKKKEKHFPSQRFYVKLWKWEEHCDSSEENLVRTIPKKCYCKLHHRYMEIRFLNPISYTHSLANATIQACIDNYKDHSSKINK